MTDTTKPTWVEALDEAKETLKAAASESTPEAIDSRTRLAYGWMDIAKLYKG